MLFLLGDNILVYLIGPRNKERAPFTGGNKVDSDPIQGTDFII